METKKIVMFRPLSGVWQFSMLQTLLQKQLEEAGHKVLLITCNGVLERYCPAMSAYGLDPYASDEQKQKICEHCKSYKKGIKDAFHEDPTDIESYLTKEDINKIDLLVKSIPNENLINFSFEGTPAGRYSAHEFFLDTKKMSYSFSDKEYPALRNSLYSFLICHTAAQKIISHFQPDMLIAYNTLHTLSRAFREVFVKNNLLVTSISGRLNLKHMLSGINIIHDLGSNYRKEALTLWPEIQNKSPKKESIIELLENIQEGISGTNIYSYGFQSISKNWNLKEHFGINNASKTALMALSSYDEYFVSKVIDVLEEPKNLAFHDQIDWVQETINWFKEHPDYSLVIRIHPRDFPNERSSALSESAKKLQLILQNLPSNVFINWPEQKVPLLPILLQIDTILIGWSSVGMDAAVLGVPALLYTNAITNTPDSLYHIRENKGEYFKKLKEIFESPLEFELNKSWDAIKWYCLMLNDLNFSLNPGLNGIIGNGLGGGRIGRKLLSLAGKSKKIGIRKLIQLKLLPKISSRNQNLMLKKIFNNAEWKRLFLEARYVDQRHEEKIFHFFWRRYSQMLKSQYNSKCFHPRFASIVEGKLPKPHMTSKVNTNP